jgi:hypothetical protein
MEVLGLIVTSGLSSAERCISQLGVKSEEVRVQTKRSRRVASGVFALVVVSLLAVFVASEATSQPADPTKSGIEGWIEGVVGDPVAGGKIAVAGWAADRAKGTPVHRVEMFLDGKPIGNATLDVPREDVATALGRPDFAKAGWTAVIELQGVAPGKHRISAIAQGASGDKQSLHGDKTIVVKPAAPAATMAPLVDPGA